MGGKSGESWVLEAKEESASIRGQVKSVRLEWHMPIGLGNLINFFPLPFGSSSNQDFSLQAGD